MAYTLGNKYAKNLCKRRVLHQLIIKNVVTCFFGTQCRTTRRRPPGMQTLTSIRRCGWSGQIASLPVLFSLFFCFLCQGGPTPTGRTVRQILTNEGSKFEPSLVQISKRVVPRNFARKCLLGV